MPKRLSKKLLSGASVGRFEKSLPGSYLPGGLAPRLKKKPIIFEGSQILSRVKTQKKVAYAKAHLADFDTEKLLVLGCEGSDEEEVVHQDVEQDVLEHQLPSSQVKTGANLMGPLLSKGTGESLLLTQGGKLIPLVPKKKMDLEEMAKKMRVKVKWTCVTCAKYITSEQGVREHVKQAQICFGRRNRMQFKSATCKVVSERVFSEEDIKKRMTEVEIH